MFWASCVMLQACATPLNFGGGERAPASVWDSCREALSELLGTRKEDLFFADPQTQSLQNFIKSSHDDYRGVTLTEDMALLLIEEGVDRSALRNLFLDYSNNSKAWVNPSEFMDRVKTIIGKYPASYGVATKLDDIYSRYFSMNPQLKKQERLNQAFQKIESLLDTVAAKSEAEKIKLREGIDLRKSLARLERYLTDPRGNVARLVGDQIVFPNGATYTILKKKSDGKVIVGIPYRNILQTQDFFDPSIAASYRVDPKLKDMEFYGTWMPDGRIIIMDQHHRTSAFHSVYGDQVPFVLTLASDGKYHTDSYLQAMKFYTSWMGVADEEKLALLAAVDRIRSRNDVSLNEQSRMIRDLLEPIYHRTLNLQSTRP